MKAVKYKSLGDIWELSCAQYADNIAFCDKDLKIQLTYKEAYNLLNYFANVFKKLNIEEKNNVSLFAINSPYWLIIEQALIANKAVCVSKTSQTTISELDFVYHNSDSCALITDSLEIIDYFIKKNENFTKNNKFILYIGNEKTDNTSILTLDEVLKKYDTNQIYPKIEDNPNSISYINYTSGTSSNPKGAMLQNNGMSYVVEELQKYCEIKKDSTFVVTFPLSSAGGKSFNLLCFSKGCKLVYTQYCDFWKTIEKLKPQYLHCAPKILQTMFQKISSYIDSKGFIFKTIFNISFKISQKIIKLNSYKIEKLSNMIFDRLIYKKVRNYLFNDDLILFVGSAHLAPALEDFFRIINVPLIQHYGLTETTGLAVSNTIESQKKYPYTVGRAFNGTKIEIINPETFELLPNGEVGLITLTGPEILHGYYKNEEATKKGLIKKNCLNTGDLGYVNKEGYLTVLSRYDDVIVMSNGYNIYAPLLENEAKDSQYINQIIIVGHGKPYLSALIVLNKEEAKKLTNNKDDFNQNEEFKNFLIEHLNEKIKRKKDFKYCEKLKKVYFIDSDFTVENGLLTNTLKVKRNKITKIYEKELEVLYKGN